MEHPPGSRTPLPPAIAGGKDRLWVMSEKLHSHRHTAHSSHSHGRLVMPSTVQPRGCGGSIPACMRSSGPAATLQGRCTLHLCCGIALEQKAPS